MFAKKKENWTSSCDAFFREFQSIKSAPDNSSLLSDQNINQFLV